MNISDQISWTNEGQPQEIGVDDNDDNDDNDNDDGGAV